MATYLIHIAGRVQGVGFRPFVYRLAKSLHIKGQVSNEPDGVNIYANADEATIQKFFHRVLGELPEHAEITNSRLEKIKQRQFADFQIVSSNSEKRTHLSLTPDLAICDACRSEIKARNNRRYGYAFTTCTNCGPRYTIVENLPYDRENTTMAPFDMCPFCVQEYNAPGNRRYFSQTNSCPKCPVSLTLYDAQQNLLSADQADVIDKTAALLLNGKIVAVKGLGGYMLMADATNSKVIQLLRKRKHRPAKPLALMYPNLALAEKDFMLSNQERATLKSAVSPIVLCRVRASRYTYIKVALIAPQNARVGVMLPYTPLFELILGKLNKPVIATSANTPNSHIIYQDASAFKSLAGIADYLLVHDREIKVPLDDSVVQFSTRHAQKIILRRSRGLALTIDNYRGVDGLLAMGADMKSTFAFTAEGLTHVSQYQGDLSAYDNQLNLAYNLKHLTDLLHFKPNAILTDKHPLYISRMLGESFAKAYKIPVVNIQHHEAHFAAVLAENKLLALDEPVLGVIWDGTGYGTNSEIRGGEFLIYHHGAIKTLNQMQPFPNLAGDKMAKEPRLAALSLSYSLEGTATVLRDKFTKSECELYYQLLIKKHNTIYTTSMGRVFDAVASFLGLCDFNSYEGEAATYLEQKASSYSDIFNLDGYELRLASSDFIPLQSVMQQIIRDKLKGISRAKIAAKFHVTLVTIVQKVAEKQGFKKLAFSGGVFQNTLLVDLLQDKLSKTHELYFHKQLPPNDACISFGQLAWMKMNERNKGKAAKLTHKSMLKEMKCA
ncbi:carbamoyltransferase HypF [Pontibacter sp. CAU 1760]